METVISSQLALISIILPDNLLSFACFFVAMILIGIGNDSIYWNYDCMSMAFYEFF